MSAVLIAVILALALGHAAPQLAQWRHYGAFAAWCDWLGAKCGAQGFFGSRFGIVLSLLPLLLLVGALQWLFASYWYGLPGVAFAVAVLFYCWGPRDLDLDVDAVVEAGDAEQRRAAAQVLLGPEREAKLDAPTLVEGVFQSALERWFGVLFWFLLLGPVGAALYRFTQVGAGKVLRAALPVEHGESYARLTRLPRQIPYIIGNEGCERFSFYGMRNVLVHLPGLLPAARPARGRAPGAAKEVMHSFIIGVYFFPLLGGWLADRWLGKYRTILYLSLVYTAPGTPASRCSSRTVNGFYAGLFLIALGSGGIKPCVSSFVGDQFDQSNKHLARVVFDAFYWIINFGSFFASLLMPWTLKAYGPAWRSASRAC
jgi:hypothetical protein